MAISRVYNVIYDTHIIIYITVLQEMNGKYFFIKTYLDKKK